MNTTKLKTIKDHASANYADWEIAKLLKAGWVLLAIRIIRPNPDSRGAFEEELIYTLGHESENP